MVVAEMLPVPLAKMFLHRMRAGQPMSDTGCIMEKNVDYVVWKSGNLIGFGSGEAGEAGEARGTTRDRRRSFLSKGYGFGGRRAGKSFSRKS